MSSPALAANLVFLKRFDPQLVRLGTLAERYFKDDPCTCLIKLRQYGELLAQLTAAFVGDLLWTSGAATVAALGASQCHRQCPSV